MSHNMHIGKNVCYNMDMEKEKTQPIDWSKFNLKNYEIIQVKDEYGDSMARIIPKKKKEINIRLPYPDA